MAADDGSAEAFAGVAEASWGAGGKTFEVIHKKQKQRISHRGRRASAQPGNPVLQIRLRRGNRWAAGRAAGPRPVHREGADLVFRAAPEFICWSQWVREIPPGFRLDKCSSPASS